MSKVEIESTVTSLNPFKVRHIKQPFLNKFCLILVTFSRIKNKYYRKKGIKTLLTRECTLKLNGRLKTL